jgi:AcrR family transcriptional regulator
MASKPDSKIQDLRVVRTRRCIQQALLDLMRESSLDKLTVGQICDAALVNKGTFYRHYQGKYDLAASTAKELLEEMDALVRERFSSRLAPAPTRKAEPESDPNGRRLGEITAGLILLQDVAVDGISVRECVRVHIASLLKPYAEQGLISGDIETESWVLAMIIFDYPAYSVGVKRPLRPMDYARSIQEVASIYEQVFRDEA